MTDKTVETTTVEGLVTLIVVVEPVVVVVVGILEFAKSTFLSVPALLLASVIPTLTAPN